MINFILILAIVAQPGYAWWAGGHFLVAQMALDDLHRTNDTDLITSLNALLNDTALFFPNSSNFVSVARWADDLHGQYRTRMFASWHFANKPFVEPNATIPKPPALTAVDNVWSTLQYCNESLARIQHVSSHPKRNGELFLGAWCLRWLVHVVGDSHQPLHATDMYNNKFPDGDRGGNKCGCHYADDPSINHLHTFWDSGGGLYGQDYSRPITKQEYALLRNQSHELREVYPRSSYTAAQLNNIDFGAWINESYAMGVKTAYLNGKFVCGSNLTTRYVDDTRTACQDRLAIGGYRLATLLRAIGPRKYRAILPAYCEANFQAALDPSQVQLTLSRELLYIVSGAALVALLALAAACFLVGRWRGRASWQSGPARFERING